ncbi:hypothetical protein N2152v2_003943 [Parachlorella kessleri]
MARPDGDIDGKDQEYSVVELPLVGDVASLPQAPPTQCFPATGPRQQRAQQQEVSGNIPWNTKKRKIEEAEPATPPLPSTGASESSAQQGTEGEDSTGRFFEGTAVLALLPNNTLTEWRVLHMTVIDFGSGREASLLVECTEGDAVKLRAPIEWQGTEAATQERLGQGCQTDLELHFNCQQLLVDAAADKELQRLQPSLCGQGAVVNEPALDLEQQVSPASHDSCLLRPIRQHATGKQGLYRTLMLEQKGLTLKEFKARANDPLNAPPAGADLETLERKYWKNVVLNPPLYGADVPGSLFDEECKAWNLGHLESVLSSTMEKHGVVIPGVNSTYLYVGSWRSTFAWHTEDLDLHSVNYLHFGAPKTWYVVPPAHRARFELLMQGLLPELFRACPEFLRHKELVVSPSLLQAHSIPVVRVVQQPGEFVVTYPGAYHCGFNQGFNCAESVNFATKTWVDIGAVAGTCACRQDTVRMDMRMFADYMSPDLREEWMASDSSSEDASPAPSSAAAASQLDSSASDDGVEVEEEEEVEEAVVDSDSDYEQPGEERDSVERPARPRKRRPGVTLAAVALPAKRARAPHTPAEKGRERGREPGRPTAAAARSRSAELVAAKGGPARVAVANVKAQQQGSRSAAGTAGAQRAAAGGAAAGRKAADVRSERLKRRQQRVGNEVWDSRLERRLRRVAQQAQHKPARAERSGRQGEVPAGAPAMAGLDTLGLAGAQAVAGKALVPPGDSMQSEQEACEALMPLPHCDDSLGMAPGSSAAGAAGAALAVRLVDEEVSAGHAGRAGDAEDDVAGLPLWTGGSPATFDLPVASAAAAGLAGETDRRDVMMAFKADWPCSNGSTRPMAFAARAGGLDGAPGVTTSVAGPKLGARLGAGGRRLLGAVHAGAASVLPVFLNTRARIASADEK